MSIYQSRDFFQAPNMVRDSGFHGWRDPERGMDAPKVVIHEMQGYGVGQVFDFFRKAIGKPRKPAHGHAHGEVLALHVGRGNAFRIRLSGDLVRLCTDKLGWAVFALRVLEGAFAVQLNEHGVINFAAEGTFYRFQIRLVAVCGQLDAVSEPTSQVFDKHLGGIRIACSKHPARHQLGIRTQCGPRPNVAIAKLTFLGLRHVLFLGIAKGPDFVALEPLAGEIPQGFILIGHAGCPNLGQELNHGVLGYAGHADGGPDGIAFNKASEDLGAALGIQFVHGLKHRPKCLSGQA